MEGAGQGQRTGKENGTPLRQAAESLSPVCLQCITLWVTSDTREFSEMFPRAFIGTADLKKCFDWWYEVNFVWFYLVARAELEVVSQHEIKGFIYAIRKLPFLS